MYAANMNVNVYFTVHDFFSIDNIRSFIQALKQVSNTVFSEIMTIERVNFNKFRVITGRKSPLTRYHRAIQIFTMFRTITFEYR